MRRPDGWYKFLAFWNCLIYSKPRGFFFMFSVFTAAVSHWTAARLFKHGAMCCTGNEENRARWLLVPLTNESRQWWHNPPASRLLLTVVKWKIILLMFYLFFLHIHYWLESWSTDSEFSLRSSQKTFWEFCTSFSTHTIFSLCEFCRPILQLTAVSLKKIQMINM